MKNSNIVWSQMTAKRWLVGLLAGCLAVATGCGQNPGGEPVVAEDGAYTYRLAESTSNLTLWTTPVAHKLLQAERAPERVDSGLHLSAARNEFEPIQLIVDPGAGSLSVEVAPFANLGGDARLELHHAGYVDGITETLTPLTPGQSITLAPNAPQSLWLTVYVPKQAPAGEHETTLTLTAGGDSITVPVHLHVFDFTLPDTTHFATQLNVNVSNLIPPNGDTEDAKDLLFEHRLTPKSVTWPSGFGWNITWDNQNAPAPCEQFYDEPDEGEPYSIRHLARKYIHGEGWNGTGFSQAMLFQFVDNATPRPATFCGLDRGDHYGSDAYNAEWSQWLGQLTSYLDDAGMLDKAYYYVQNEPQNDADHALAAHLCRLTKAAAPGLKIAISEEPKPEIAEDPGGACGYDIWIAHTRAYDEPYAHMRQQAHGETVWFYSLDHDPDPYFNPTRVDAQGMHTRIIPWAAFSHRIRGWAYYDANRFFSGHNPGIRAELLREAMEDYEYIFLANGEQHPQPGQEAIADPTVRSVAQSMTSWIDNPDALMVLRHELGRYLEGSRSTLPILETDDDSAHPRMPYAINFQDPAGEPTDDPLMARGKQWLKVGWEPWDDTRGYGWKGEHIDNPSIALYGYDNAGADVIENSYLYDDYGRNNLFEFGLENGRYAVTVGVGRPAKGYPNDPHNLVVEGVVAVDDEVTTDAAPVISRTVEVELTDGRLSLEVGGMSQQTGNWSYTFLHALEIEPLD